MTSVDMQYGLEKYPKASYLSEKQLMAVIVR